MENSVLLMLLSFFSILHKIRLVEPKSENGMMNSYMCHSAESK